MSRKRRLAKVGKPLPKQIYEGERKDPVASEPIAVFPLHRRSLEGGITDDPQFTYDALIMANSGHFPIGVSAFRIQHKAAVLEPYVHRVGFDPSRIANH